MSKDKIKEICTKLLDMFARGELPPAVARTVIQRQQGDDKPCDRWSFCNHLIMLINNTNDARGYRMWAEAGRAVKTGTKAFYILAPITQSVTTTNVDRITQQDRQDKISIIKGFRPIPVFRIEDTEGAPIPVADYRPPKLPPLYDVAEYFGIKVDYLPYFNRELGSFSTDGTIRLYSTDIDVFLHEISHAAHNSLKPLKPGQHDDQEIVAEMSALVLCELYGYKDCYTIQGWDYIRHYSDMEPSKALRAIMGVLNDVEAVVGKILLVDAQLSSVVNTLA